MKLDDFLVYVKVILSIVRMDDVVLGRVLCDHHEFIKFVFVEDFIGATMCINS